MSDPRTVEEQRAQIDQTREELGETVHALAEKLDVKAQAKRRLTELTSRVATKLPNVSSNASGNSGVAVDRLWFQLNEFIRSNPPRAAGMALIIGLVVGRKTKIRRKR